MKFTKNFYIIMFVALNSTSLIGQLGTNLAHERYWYYRTRLNNDFVKVGPNTSESLPIPERNINVSVDLHMGDELSTMGIYLGVLGTEYHLLRSNGQNVNKIEKELFYALNAINRLDYTTEPLFDVNTSPSLDGFMIKDDMDERFPVNNYSHFNYFNTSSNSNGQAIDGTPSHNIVDPNSTLPWHLAQDHGFCGTAPLVKVVESDYKTIFNQHSTAVKDQAGTVINQDQYISLLIGLSLINKYVDGNANFNNQIFPYENGSGYSNTSSIQQEAKNITNRIWHYFNFTCNWDLYNPVTGIHQTRFYGINDSRNYDYGGDAAAMSYPISESVCHINGFSAGTEGDYYLRFPPSLVNPPSSCSRSSGPSIGFVLWNQLHTTTGFGKVDNGAFIANLSATCDCGWDAGSLQTVQQLCTVVTSLVCDVWSWFGGNNQNCNSVLNQVCNLVTYVDPIVKNNTYEDMLNAVGYWHFDHAPLLYHALNGHPTPQIDQSLSIVQMSTARSLVNTAPCEGPYNLGAANRATYEWSSDSRIEHPDRRQWWADPIPDPNKDVFPANYNGLDYMLYHNLLRIGDDTYNYGPYFDLSDRIVSGTLNYPGATPTRFGAFETITFQNCTVPAGSNVEFRAGKYFNGVNTDLHYANGASVHLLPAQPYSCSNNIYQRSAQDSSSMSSDYGDLGTNPTDYVSSKASSPNTFTPSLVSENYISPKKNLIQPSIDIDKGKKWDLYPNPNNGTFNIQISMGENERYSIQVYNVLGDLIYQEDKIKGYSSISSRNIRLSEMGAGVYYLKLATTTGFSESKKFIIE